MGLAYQHLITARQTLEILETGVIQPNQESFQIVQLAYRLGEMLLDIVNQQRVVVEAETNYANAKTEFNATLADLELATATVVNP